MMAPVPAVLLGMAGGFAGVAFVAAGVYAVGTAALPWVLLVEEG